MCRSSSDLAALLESRYFARGVLAGRGLAFEDNDLVEQVYAMAAEQSTYAFRELPKYQRRAASVMFRSIARGVTDETMSRVREQLLKDVRAAVQLPPEARERAVRRSLGRIGIAGADKHVVRTIVRTQTSIADSAAYWVVTRGNPDVWGYELVVHADERTRPAHWAMRGVRYPKEHIFWRRYFPPNGYNCRCRGRAIKFGDPRARVRAFEGTPEVDPGFRFNPGMLMFGVNSSS
jgi:SPP1 gp7 family putative phage head morphogenesis protein